VSEAVSAGGYRQVAIHLRERVESGAYLPGSQLPTEADLVEEFEVARDTVRRAIALLAEEGLVVTVHGRGTYVRSDSDENGQPKHAQVAAKLRALIESDEAQAGTAFLTEAEVQGRYSVSRRTARAALKGLEDDGLLLVVGRRRVVASHRPG
jgi:DNA-binding GntR family transcriptional regulator